MANKEITNEISFEGQNPREEVILILNNHPMVLYPLGLGLVLSWIVVVTIVVISGFSIYSSVALVLFVVVGGYKAFYKWYLWKSSQYLLTSQRVVVMDQLGFFKKVVSEAALDKIQNVSFEIEGPYQTFMNFGTVKIMTAGKDTANVNFKAVPEPQFVQQEITNAAHNFVRSKDA